MLIIIAFSGLADRLKSSKKCDRKLSLQKIDRPYPIAKSDFMAKLA
ncbi:hypothetical protein Q5690_28120 [Microcoleus sp. F10-D1]